MRHWLALSLIAATAAAQPVFIAEGNYNPYDATKSPLFAWDGTAFHRANVLTGYSMQAPRPVNAFRGTNGKTYVIAQQAFYGHNFFVYEYANGSYLLQGSTRVGNSSDAANGTVLSPDGTRAYVLMLAEGAIYTISLTNLNTPAVIGSPIPVPGGRVLDIRPQGDRILVLASGAVVHDVNLLTGTVTTLNLGQPYFQPQVRYSPDGTFAYFGLEDVHHSFVILNTATYPATLHRIQQGPGGNFGMADLAFHPTLKRAYFMSWPAGSTASASLYVIDTDTHTPIGFTQVFNNFYAPYNITIEPDGSKIWMASARNSWYLHQIPLDPAGVPQMSTLYASLPDVTTSTYGIAVIRPLVGTTPAFLATIGTRSGGAAARIWPLNLRNTGSTAVFGAQVTQVMLTQIAGPPCSPVSATTFPIAYGNLGPGQTVTQNVTWNFTGCANTVRFRAEALVGAGPSAQTLTLATSITM